MHGVLNIHKPSGVTSRDVVNQVQRIVRPAKVGHAGTLDPLASGVLVIGVGAATRLIEYVQRMEKRYRATFLLGCSSDTDDVEGAVNQVPAARVPSLEELRRAVASFVGRVDQVPPAYSAVKVKGKRAYARARAGEEVDLKPRPVHIHELEILQYDYPELRILVRCGSGVYVRAIGRDLARSAGTQAVMSALVRTGIGLFDLSTAVSPSRLSLENVGQFLLPLAAATSALPSIRLDPADQQRLRHGQAIVLPDHFSPEPPAGGPPLARGATSQDKALAQNQPVEFSAVDQEGRLLAVVRRQGQQLRPIKNLN